MDIGRKLQPEIQRCIVSVVDFLMRSGYTSLLYKKPISDKWLHLRTWSVGSISHIDHWCFIYINIIRSISMMSFLYTGYVYSICIPLKSWPQYALKVNIFLSKLPNWFCKVINMWYFIPVPFLPLCRIKNNSAPRSARERRRQFRQRFFFWPVHRAHSGPSFAKGKTCPPFEVEKVVRRDLAAWGETMYTCGKWIPSPSWIACWM